MEQIDQLTEGQLSVLDLSEEVVKAVLLDSVLVADELFGSAYGNCDGQVADVLLYLSIECSPSAFRAVRVSIVVLCQCKTVIFCEFV